MEELKSGGDYKEIAISLLKSRRSPGPDNFPVYILKGCKEWTKGPSVHVFNLALSAGEYPYQWKVTRVHHIPKSNDSTRIENYHPIVILSSTAKAV